MRIQDNLYFLVLAFTFVTCIAGFTPQSYTKKRARLVDPRHSSYSKFETQMQRVPNAVNNRKYSFLTVYVNDYLPLTHVNDRRTIMVFQHLFALGRYRCLIAFTFLSYMLPTLEQTVCYPVIIGLTNRIHDHFSRQSLCNGLVVETTREINQSIPDFQSKAFKRDYSLTIQQLVPPFKGRLTQDNGPVVIDCTTLVLFPVLNVFEHSFSNFGVSQHNLNQKLALFRYKLFHSSTPRLNEPGLRRPYQQRGCCPEQKLPVPADSRQPSGCSR